MDAPLHAAPLQVGELVPRRVRQVLLLLLVLAAGASIVALERVRPGGHEVLVIALALGIPTFLLVLLRPRMGLAVYLVLLPMVTTGSVMAGLNGGELLTGGVILLAVPTAWRARARVGRALRTLGPALWPLAALAFVSVGSLVANQATSFADILSAFLKILVFALVPLLVYLNADDEKRARGLILAVLAGGVVVAVYSIVRFALGMEYYAYWDYHRAAGPFTDWNQLGGFMALTAVPTLGYGLNARRGLVRWLFIVGFVLQIVALLVSLTMGSVLALLVGGLLGGVLLFRIPLRRIAATLAGFVLVFLAVLAANPFLQEKMSRLGERVVDRLIGYSVGVSMIRDKLLFGFGSTDRVVEALYASTEYTVTPFGIGSAIPHASLVLIGVQNGILGVFFYLFLIVGIVRLLVRQRAVFEGSRYHILYQGMVVGLLAFLVQDMTNNLLLHARLGILFLSLLAGMIALGERLGRQPAT